MRTKEEIMEGMDAAAEQADEALETLWAELSPEELAGVRKVVAWLEKWYLSAGYKRLNRSLRAIAKEG